MNNIDLLLALNKQRENYIKISICLLTCIITYYALFIQELLSKMYENSKDLRLLLAEESKKIRMKNATRI